MLIINLYSLFLLAFQISFDAKTDTDVADALFIQVAQKGRKEVALATNNFLKNKCSRICLEFDLA